MPTFATITVHESQWPDALGEQLRQSLRCRRINHKFHYESPRQVRQWLRLHEAWSPAQQQVDSEQTYEPAFEAVLNQLGSEPVHLIGLGCGGGQKEAALLRRLAAGQRRVTFTGTDVSSGMVITTLQAARAHVEPGWCFGLVCDLALARNLEAYFDAQTPPGARRVVTFFGMIPNFEPAATCELLQRLTRPGDFLLCSANLAPGADYRQGVEWVLPQYDNALTREWLWLLLSDLGFDCDPGGLRFTIREAPAGSGLLRIEAALHFQSDATATVEGDTFEFEAGSTLQVFFSYRHTVATLTRLLTGVSPDLKGSWLSASGEEGVFLLERADV